MTQTVLVTGGSKRVGRGLCLGLAEAGYRVAVHYNGSQQAADKLVDEIRAKGGQAVSVAANLEDEQQTRGLMDQVIGALGPVDLLINNASVFEEDSLARMTGSGWDRHFNIHVKAPSLLAGAFAEQQLDDGLIVNVIDERVWKLTPNFHSYTLSKSAMWTATKTMAQALAPSVRVNAIGPGPTLPSDHQTQGEFDRQIQTLLLKRSPALSEFVDTILYFVTAKSVTGQMIALDGGQHLGWQTPDQMPLK